jgi:hypothetical protein
MKDNLEENQEEKPSNTLTSKEIVVSVSIALLFALMLILGIIQHDKNVMLEKIVSSLMTQVMKDKVDFLDADLDSMNKRIVLNENIISLRERVKKTEIALKLNDNLHELMMNTDKSILDACNISIEALQASIELGTVCEYLETYNNIKVVPKKMEEKNDN